MSVIFTIFTENDWHLDTLWKCYLLCPFRLKKFQPNLFAQAQKFRIFEKKSSLWVSVIRDPDKHGRKLSSWKTVLYLQMAKMFTFANGYLFAIPSFAILEEITSALLIAMPS